MNGADITFSCSVTGGILEQHMIGTGCLPAPAKRIVLEPAAIGVIAASLGMLCLKCSQPGVIKEGADLTCHHCGWSQCG